MSERQRIYYIYLRIGQEGHADLKATRNENAPGGYESNDIIEAHSRDHAIKKKLRQSGLLRPPPTAIIANFQVAREG